MSFQKQISELADKKLLDWLQNGKEQLLEDGRSVRRDLTAAEMTCILKRLAQLGVNAMPVKGSAAGNLVEAARANLTGFKFKGKPVLPPVNTEDDDAATGSG